MNYIKSFSFLMRICLIALLSIVSVFGAASDVDQTFTTTVGRDQSQSVVTSANIALQPDGKALAYGTFHNVNGKPRTKVVRLNTDGSLDDSFSCACDDFRNIRSIIVQTDGRILVAGEDNSLKSKFHRLNSDGSIDFSFTSPFGPLGGSSSHFINVWAIQPDGKIFATRHIIGFENIQHTLYRLNADGSFDNSFAALTFGSSGLFLSNLKVLPDGKIMISGNHSFGQIFRLNSDGTKDTSFESPALISFSQGVSASIADFGFQSDGKLVITGNFISVNGVSRSFLARLNANGSVDLQFSNSFTPVTNSSSIEILSNDKILIQTPTGAPNAEPPYFFRLNADGTLDNSFSAANSVVAWQLDAQERIVFTANLNSDGVSSLKLGRMNTNGSLDNSFNLAIFGITGEVTALGLQTDGKVLIGGYFNRVNTVVRRGLSRVNVDGTLDTTFDAGSGVGDSAINVIAVQTDGKILIGGAFPTYNGIARQGIARLNSDGSLDLGFNPLLSSSGAVNTIIVQTDGKILIGGNFSSVGGTSRTSLARLNADGSLDNSFNPIIGGNINSLLIQTDGKLMIGGAFSGVNGFNRTNLARLNADVSLDTTFNAAGVSGISQIVQQTDGKYLIINSGTISRRNADGSADSSFQSPTLTGAKKISLQPDGSIIVVGDFFTVNSATRRNIVRLLSNGSVNTLFFPLGANSKINTLAVQTDGKLILGGNFTTIENVLRSGIARLVSAFRGVTPFDFDGDGRADVSVFRASENRWYILQSSNGQVVQKTFAISGDIPAPADFDGDGKTDVAIFRPSTGDWWSLSSLNNSQTNVRFGQSGDIPRPSDFDGDGRADYIFFRPSISSWGRLTIFNVSSSKAFGLTGDKPVTGDFDGDGKSDVAIFRPSTGDWWWQSSIDNVQRATHWGISTDISTAADFDGDGKTDFAVYRPSNGTWYILNSSNGQATIINFGIAEDKPVAADYDGDGKADIAVFRPSTGVWYLLRSTAGFTALQFGVSTDTPIPNSFVP